MRFLSSLASLLAVSLLHGLTPTAMASLTAHYPLDSITGGTTTPDTTGLNGAGTVNGSPSVVAGQLGNAFDFAGGDAEFVGISDPGFGQTTFTASVWFNPDTLGNQGPLANWTNVGASPRTFLIRTAGSTLQTFVRSGAAQVGGDAVFSTEALTTGGFNHAVITYDGTSMRTFLNGELSTNVYSFGGASILGEGILGTAAIGGRTAGSSERDMTGLIDDVAFWDEQLTADEVIGLSDVAGISYDASQFDLMKGIHDAGSGSVNIGGTIWGYQSGLVGGAGLDGAQSTLILNAQGGTGLVIIPEPSGAALFGLGALGLLMRRRRKG